MTTLKMFSLFPTFPTLPTELRQLIWTFTFPRNREINTIQGPYEPKDRLIATLSTTQESRIVALRYYTQLSNHQFPYYADFTNDVFSADQLVYQIPHFLEMPKKRKDENGNRMRVPVVQQTTLADMAKMERLSFDDVGHLSTLPEWIAHWLSGVSLAAVFSEGWGYPVDVGQMEFGILSVFSSLKKMRLSPLEEECYDHVNQVSVRAPIYRLSDVVGFLKERVRFNITSHPIAVSLLGKWNRGFYRGEETWKVLPEFVFDLEWCGRVEVDSVVDERYFRGWHLPLSSDGMK